jgi:hypothetical protein
MVWSIRVYIYVIWIHQCPCLLHVLDEQIIHGIFGQVVVEFIDDILVFSKNEEEHDKHLCMVLQKLREN